MNLPNRLTLMRIILIPVIILIYLFPYSAYGIEPHVFHIGFVDLSLINLITLAFYVLAAVTDALDGHIARSRNLVTTFGKFLDPLADKILVISALVCFIEVGVCGSVPVLIIIAREFMVSGLRLVTADKGVVVPANIWGKLKTAFTMVRTVIRWCWSACGKRRSKTYPT